MKHYAKVAVCLGALLAGCGGGQTSVTEPSVETEAPRQPTGEAESPESQDVDVAPEPDENESDEIEQTKTSTPSSEENKQESSPQSTTESDRDVKEAIEARITDKHIVISGKVLFETGNAKLKKVSHAVLDQVVSALLKHPEIIKLQVVGHTDSDGDAKANKRLSKRRATSVMKYLIKEGIERDRLLSVGVGEDDPIASNDTEEGKDKNRRVEFIIVERAKVMATTHTTSTTDPGKVKSRRATNDETEDIIKERGLEKKLH